MIPDYRDLLNKIALRMEAVTSVDYSITPRGLFTFQMNEASSMLPDGPASVLRIYGGELPYVPTPRVSIQCMTTSPGENDSAGLDRAALLITALVDTNNRPLRNLALPGFKVLGFLNISLPGQIGRDTKGRAEWVFNFDVELVPTE